MSPVNVEPMARPVLAAPVTPVQATPPVRPLQNPSAAARTSVRVITPPMSRMYGRPAPRSAAAELAVSVPPLDGQRPGRGAGEGEAAAPGHDRGGPAARAVQVEGAQGGGARRGRAEVELGVRRDEDVVGQQAGGAGQHDQRAVVDEIGRGVRARSVGQHERRPRALVGDDLRLGDVLRAVHDRSDAGVLRRDQHRLPGRADLRPGRRGQTRGNGPGRRGQRDRGRVPGRLQQRDAVAGGRGLRHHAHPHGGQDQRQGTQQDEDGQGRHHHRPGTALGAPAPSRPGHDRLLVSEAALWPSPPSWPALRVSQPCLFMVRKA